MKGEGVIDPDRMVERFLGRAVESYGEDAFPKYDSPAIDALKPKGQNQSRGARQGAIHSFLRSYGVFRGLDNDEASAVVNEILGFADNRSLTSPTTREEIIDLFRALHDRCREKVHRNKDGTLRDLSSLTSKALWCCYPDAIPLFDSRAARALCVISRLMGLTPPPSNNKSRYEPFLSVWLDLYARVEPTIDQNRRRVDRIPHKVRVLDLVLWTIGEPDFWA